MLISSAFNYEEKRKRFCTNAKTEKNRRKCMSCISTFRLYGSRFNARNRLRDVLSSEKRLTLMSLTLPFKGMNRRLQLLLFKGTHDVLFERIEQKKKRKELE